MNTKLTLSIDEDVIAKAKDYASSQGISLSNIVENYLKVVSIYETKVSKEYTPLIKSMKGAFKDEQNLDYKESLEEELSKKYLNL